MMSHKRYAVVGTGSRCQTFIDAIVRDYADQARLVAFCDNCQTRMDWHNRRVETQFGHPPVDCYLAENFDRMVRQARPDVVIVTTTDATHHVYIIRAMELGCDVLCEKPMTIDADKANAILLAQQRTGRSLRVTFNCRYTPFFAAIRKEMISGVIGQPTAMDLSWSLDTRHGADYFRRWHATKANSGGLLLHKSTHHFDLVNWWLDARPRTVYAMGGLKFYGQANAKQRHEHYAYPRYTGHAESARDPFARTLDESDMFQGLYLQAEDESGYIRDRNVFGSHVDIEDTLAVMVRYDSGAVLNYALTAYSPWEGFHGVITGTRGRIIFHEQSIPHVLQDGQDISKNFMHKKSRSIDVYPMFQPPHEVEIPRATGGHGGGDPLMLRQLLDDANPPADPLGQAASHADGAASIAIGIAANESIATGQPIDCMNMIPLMI